MFGLKKIKFVVILLLIISMTFPLGIVQAAAAENYNLRGWDKQQQKWSPGNQSGFSELDWVPFQLEVKNYIGDATEICFQHDYEKLGTFGFLQSQSFYIGDSVGNQLFSLSSGVFSISGPEYRTDNSGVKIIEYCFEIIDVQALKDLGENFFLYWESQLAGPKQASTWSGASLHTTTSVTGAQTVPINVQQINPILEASLELQKTVSTPVANPGDEVTYTFTVMNTGDYNFSGVAITDALFGAEWSHSVGALSTGSSISFEEVYTIPADAAPGPLVNTATATGTYANGTVSDTDDESFVIQTVTADSPSIDIHKTVHPTVAKPGDEVLYSIHVTNTGNIDLENVIVTDPLFGDAWHSVIETLHAGQIVWLEATYTIPGNASSGLLVNTVSVTGTYPGGSVSNDANASLNIETDTPPELVAGVELTKTVESETVNSGDTVTYHFTVKNTGTYELTDITVEDPLFGADWSYQIELLQPGESVTFEHDYLVAQDHAPGIIQNTATVTANYADGSVTDTTSETVSVVAKPTTGEASLHVDKSANVQTAVPGETVNYTIHVMNDGNTDLTNVILTDHLMGDSWEYSFGSLHIGETKEYSYSYTIPLGTLAGELVNTALVAADHEDGMVSKSDTATVNIDAPLPEISNLILTSVCSEDPDLTRQWKITNTNHVEMPYSWILIESGEMGSGVVGADSDLFLETLTVSGINTLKITYHNDMVESKVSSGLQCDGTEMRLITVHSTCVASPQSNQVEWQINNPNDYTVEASWESENQAGDISLAPGITLLYTPEISGRTNTLTLYINGEKYAVTLMACLKNIELSALCSENPDQSLRWRLTNNNPTPIDVTWLLVDSSPMQTGIVTAQPGETYFNTNTISGDNIVAIFVDDVLQRNGTVMSLKLVCPPGETATPETGILGEVDVDLGDAIEPMLPDGTTLIEDILGATDVLPETGGIFAWYLYMPGILLIASGTIMLKANTRPRKKKEQHN